MNSNKKLPIYIIGKEGIPYACNFIPTEYGWHELANCIDDLVDSAKYQAASLIEAYIYEREMMIAEDEYIPYLEYVKKHNINIEDLTLHLNEGLILYDRGSFVIYICDFLDHFVWPVHFNNSSDKISEWEISCGGWPAVKDDILKYYIPEI